MQSQNDIILAHMQTGKTIDPMTALNSYQCFRLASRINELRRAGHNIGSEWRESLQSGKRWKEYFLISVDKSTDIV